MPKNILIFCDGTGQAGGLLPDEARSNIYKLFRATRCGPDTSIDPARQVAFYDPGLGSKADGSPWWGKLGRGIYNVFAQATGLGITRNIIDCYAYILRVFEDGDRVYLFGFSRGAYTARCVGGVLSYCGVPTCEADGKPLGRGPVTTRTLASEAVKQVYQHGSSMAGDPLKAERMQRAASFRAKYAAGDANGPNVWPYFIGVFDTVATLGFGKARFWPFVALCFAALVIAVKSISWAAGFLLPGLRLSWTGSALIVIGAALVTYLVACIRFRGVVSLARYRMAFYDDRLGRGIAFARHALSIDENRRDFERVAWRLDGVPADVAQEGPGDRGPERLIQMWFTGVHSDVGGGYEEAESRLSDAALDWMIGEARRLPDPILVDDFYLRTSPSGLGVAHDEFKAMKDRLPRWLKAFGWTFGARRVPNDAPLHSSVIQRFAASTVVAYDRVGPYRPEALRNHELVKSYYFEA
jgi:uncharacterized protein (DUF2235 family)